MPYKSADRKRQRDHEYYAENREQITARESRKYHNNREPIRARRLELAPQHRPKNNERERVRAASLRAEMIRVYGGQCQCCGEDEPTFLELDHVGGNGKQHREEIGRGSKTTYAWLKRKGWPKDGFDLLCANCHQGRHRNGGTCPHKREANPLLIEHGQGYFGR